MQAQEIIAIIIAIIGGIVAVYFLIRYQINKRLKEIIDLQEREIRALKEQGDRHEKEIAILNSKYEEIKRKKNYLKQIVMEAMQTKQDIRSVLEASLKSNNKETN